MNLLTKRIIFIKTGLLLLVILFFLGCKKEKNKIGLDDPSRFPTNTYYTDTITVKSEVILVKDSIITTNVSIGGSTSFLLAGAYTDPDIGTVEVQAFTQLQLAQQYVELPSAIADSAYLYLSYSYYYGDIAVPQTLKVHKLTSQIESNTIYTSASSAIAYDPLEVGSIVGFTASPDSGTILKIKITDLSYLQSILDASKSNAFFVDEIPGIALIPGDNSSGAILRFDGGSFGSFLRIYYDLYNDNIARSYLLTLNNTSRKFYRVLNDRSGTDLDVLPKLINSYDSLSSTVLNNKCYIQSLASLRTRISFPYLENFKKVFPNMAIIDAYVYVASTASSQPSKYLPSSGLVLLKTEWDGTKWRIKKDASLNPYYVQPNDYSQTANSVVKVTTPVDGGYLFPVRSYFQSILLGQVPNHPVIISPSLVYTEANRVVFGNSDPSNADKRLSARLYFTTTK